jgi:hypothetical protein
VAGEQEIDRERPVNQITTLFLWSQRRDSPSNKRSITESKSISVAESAIFKFSLYTLLISL